MIDQKYHPDYTLETIFQIFYEKDEMLEHLDDDELKAYCADLLFYMLPDMVKRYYKTRGLISIGGESTCILSYDLLVRRLCVFKVAKLAMSGDTVKIDAGWAKESKARFLRGFSIQNILSESIVRSVGIVPRVYAGYYWPPVCEMEYLYGKHPLDWVSGKRKEEIFIVLFRLALLLNNIHRLGVLHRDLKTDNLMIIEKAGQQTLGIFDFSMSMPTRESDLGQTSFVTVVPTRFCTPLYASPLMKINPSEATKRDDIFSFGRIIWVWMNGVEPENIKDISPDSLPSGMRRIYLRCISSDMDEQYSSCDELINDLFEYAKKNGINLSGILLPDLPDKKRVEIIKKKFEEVGSETEHYTEEDLSDLAARKIKAKNITITDGNSGITLNFSNDEAGAILKKLTQYILFLKNEEVKIN